MSVEQTPVGDLGKAADFLENVSNGKQAVSEAEAGKTKGSKAKKAQSEVNFVQVNEADEEFARGAQIIADLIDSPTKLVIEPEAQEILKDVSEGVLKAEYDAEIAALKAEIAALKAPKPKPQIGTTPADRNMILAMRSADPADKKTCAACKTRRPLGQMSNGLAEVCDICLS